MKIVILAGGLPSTINTEEEKIPKPMLRVGGRPLLWHIMKLYSYYGYNDFVICTGYKSEMIKEYFMNYYIYKSDITVNLQNNEVVIHNKETEQWKVTVVYTGVEATTASRIFQIRDLLKGEDFIVSYGDCVSDINISQLVNTHKKNGQLLTLTVARPAGRSAILPMSRQQSQEDRDTVRRFAWANACNMVVSSEIYEHMDPDERFEIDTVNRVIEEGRVATYEHEGLWVPVETVRDRALLEDVWRTLIYNQ